MRLTLRTLLAWLDDTLSPTEVREIGKQVQESEFAKELVARIQRVTRQRRLTVPPRSGPDSIDANIVASYLDNELDPEEVAELEKRCLTSDVHLAEVSSVHQVLSLIGQKAKVPMEARHRMYQLIKGRESVRPRALRASRQTEPPPVSEPVQPWVTPAPPPRPLAERFGPAAAVLILMLLACWSAKQTLTPVKVSPVVSLPLGAIAPSGFEKKTRAPAPDAVHPPAPLPAETTSRPAGPPLEAKAEPRTENAAKSTAASATVPPDIATRKKTVSVVDRGEVARPDMKGKKEDADKSPAPKSAPVVAAGSVGLAKKPDGVLLRSNPERRNWERLTADTPLFEQDHVLSLAPFRATIQVGKADINLIDESEVLVFATPASRAARLSLLQGRIVLHGTTPGLPFEILSASKTYTVNPPPGVAVGVERLNRLTPGELNSATSVLRFQAIEGPLKISAGKTEETLDGPGSVIVDSAGKFSDKKIKAAPSWLTETEPAPFDQKIGEQFLKFFRSDREIVSSLVEASEDEQKDVCRLAISALRAVGDISFIVPLLKRQGYPTAASDRKAAISVLRSYLAQGPGAAKFLREQLQQELGAGLAVTTEKLLIGYTPKEAREPSTYTKLVQLLESTQASSVGVRELALDNLKQLTGRDDLEYDPESPTPDSKGLKSWRELLKAGDLHPASDSPRNAR
ncbi:MAG: hypothetical protein NVSMB9_05660 [Isosphaeraceae bacterium]